MRDLEDIMCIAHTDKYAVYADQYERLKVIEDIEHIVEINKTIEDIAKTYKDNPEEIAELMKFASKFYRYLSAPEDMKEELLRKYIDSKHNS